MNQKSSESDASLTPWPEWYKASLARAGQALEDLQPPSPRSEAWRFGLPSKENTDGLALAESAPREAIISLARERRVMQGALQIVYANGRAISIPEQLPDGLEVLGIGDFIRRYPEQARRFLDSQPVFLGSERLALANMVNRNSGLVIVANGEISTPLEILHFIDGDRVAAYPFTLVVAQPNSRLRILERHLSVGSEKQFCGAWQQFELSAASSVKYALSQELNSSSRTVELGVIMADDSAEMEHLTSHPGSAWARQETLCQLRGSGANVRLLSANALNGSRKLDQRTYQKHVYRGAQSDLFYANVLGNSAEAVFSGMIQVSEGAHDTNAYQSNRNLLLSPNAAVHSIPGLEILADRVQCSHGTAISSISPEEVFYLLSRGIPKQKACDMIANGFLKNALTQFSDEEIRAAVEGIILS